MRQPLSGLGLVGCPGSGKGTLAGAVAEALGIVSVSTGKIIRDEIASQTCLGVEVEASMAAGFLLTDDVAIRLLNTALDRMPAGCRYVLDGFPRTVYQARDFARSKYGAGLTAVFVLHVDDAAAAERIAGRLVCPQCGASYHDAYRPPARPGRCNADDGLLQRRPEDHHSVVATRMQVYREEAKTLIAYYQSLGIVHAFDVNGELDRVSKRFIQAVGDVLDM